MYFVFRLTLTVWQALYHWPRCKWFSTTVPRRIILLHVDLTLRYRRYFLFHSVRHITFKLISSVNGVELLSIGSIGFTLVSVNADCVN